MLGRGQAPRIVVETVSLWPEDYADLLDEGVAVDHDDHLTVLTCNGETRVECMRVDARK